MKKTFLIAAVLFLVSVPAQAQDTYPSSEIFGGYSYFNNDSLDNESMHGFAVSFAGNLSSKVGIVGEFSGHYASFDIPFGSVDTSTYLFLFGPRFSARSEKVTGFGHVLFGGARSKLEDFDSQTHFAMAFGGGVDVHATKRVAFRLIQADYIPVRAGGDWSNNFRLSTGIVFRLE